MSDNFEEDPLLMERVYHAADEAQGRFSSSPSRGWEIAFEQLQREKVKRSVPKRLLMSRRSLFAVIGGTMVSTVAIERGAMAVWKQAFPNADQQVPLSCGTSPVAAEQGTRRRWPLLGYDVHMMHNNPNIVRVIQYMLKAREYNIGVTGVDGVFGEKTLAAVQAFQKRDSVLDAHGTVDDPTWEKLVLVSKRPNQGSHVQALHERLVAWSIAADLEKKRTFSERTEEAVRRFQHQHSLNMTGRADLDTWCLLVGGILVP